MDGWNTMKFPFGAFRPISRGVLLLVSGYVSWSQSMVVSGSPKRWDRWHSPSPNWQYIPLIVLAFWAVKNATDPTF